MIRVGVDFDNTIVCYDGLFRELAARRGIPGSRARSKGELRDYLRGAGREEEWTALQGEAYGEAMGRAEAYPGALDFLRRCVREGVEARIISHKTRFPFRGPRCDLHEAARRWLESKGVFEPGFGLSPWQVHFEPSKEEKLRRIASEGCTHFIDDLPEFLLEPAFPAGVDRILFDPSDRQAESACYLRAASWGEIERRIFNYGILPGDGAATR